MDSVGLELLPLLGGFEVELPEVLEEHFLLVPHHLAYCNGRPGCRFRSFMPLAYDLYIIVAVMVEERRPACKLLCMSRQQQDRSRSEEQEH